MTANPLPPGSRGLPAAEAMRPPEELNRQQIANPAANW
jgi:hypothetical protein